MNKEFKILEDGNIEVIDEKGQITKRYCSNSIQNELLSENKSELIENKLNDAQKKLKENKKVVDLSKWMLIFQPIIIGIASIIGFIQGAILNTGNILIGGLYNALYLGLFTSFIAIIPTVYWAIIKKIFKKKIKNNETMITSINIIKKNFEKENKNIKENEYTRKGHYPNATFNLEKDTKQINDNLDRQINMVYESNKGYSPKLTMKRK